MQLRKERINSVHDIEYIELIGIGTLTKVVIDPTDVFNFAVSKKCKTIILCHNHPSGKLEASPKDLSLTRTLKNGAKYLNIFILDHIIITEDDYMSFADEDFNVIHHHL